MTTLREAAMMALEALDAGIPISPRSVLHDRFRAALAQQDEGGGNLPPPLQVEPTGKQPLQVESVAAVAENATTQQRVVETPPSDYRRGYWDGFSIGKREGLIEAEDALAQQDKQDEPVAWRVRGYSQFKTGEPRPWRYVDGTGKPAVNEPDCCDFEPLYLAPPRCPNCSSLEAQNTELDRKLAELEHAYEAGYKAGAAAERKRIIQFLTEMQRQVGDGHNYYGVAAMRIREME